MAFLYLDLLTSKVSRVNYSHQNESGDLVFFICLNRRAICFVRVSAGSCACTITKHVKRLLV